MDIDELCEADSGAVRAALVADLAHSTVPTSIMGCTLVIVAAFSYASTGMSVLPAAAVCGALASIAKVALMQMQKWRIARDPFDQFDTDYWEKAHAAVTSLIAVSVSVTATSLFMQPDANLQMIATGLVFGYCSGIVSRVGIRPRIALTALLLAAPPSILATAYWNDAPHLIMAGIFSVFLLGSFESVRHVHRTAVKHVSMRLRMATLAQRDPLTGLANRSGLQAAFQAISPENAVAVLCLDLDGFKLVNDRYGHATGDALLRAVAERLLAITASDATVVRTGGDEFVILQPGIHHGLEMADLAQRITTRLREPFLLGGEDVRIGASVGYAASPLKPTELDGLFVRADEASYRVKSTRRAGMRGNRTVSVR